MNPIIPQPQEQQQYQSPISSQKHFLNKKFIVTFVVLLLLGAGAYAGIWWWGNQNLQVVIPSVTPDPTAGWKTYRNNEYGFEFKYPEDSSIEVTEYDGKTTPVPKSVRVKISGDILVNVVYYEDYLNMAKAETIEEYIEQVERAPGDIISSNEQFEPFKNVVGIDGYISKEYGAHVLFSRKNDIASFENQKDSPSFYQILSTFKFIDPVDTSTWKTYTNTQYGFTVKYPERFLINDTLGGINNSNLTLVVNYTKPTCDNCGGSPKYLWISAEPKRQAISCEGTSGTINVGNTAVAKCTYLGSYFGEGEGLFIEVAKGNYTYTFNADFYDRNKSEIDQILSTFKFTK